MSTPPKAASGPTVDYQEPEVSELGRPCLEIVRGLPFGKPIPLDVGSVLVGRDAETEVCVDVSGVSRKHARLSVTAEAEVRLTDLGSRNGSFVNGVRVESSSLRDGDELRCGPAVLRLRFLGRSPTMAAAPTLVCPPQLSPREFEVACLVAEGLTNADVGKRLFISPATVGRHLSNIYERLQIHSRAALTRFISDPNARR